MSDRQRWGNNVNNNLTAATVMLRTMTSLRRTTLHDLFALHIKARGTLVEGRAAAETIFSKEDGITPFDLDRIGAEFMK